MGVTEFITLLSLLETISNSVIKLYAAYNDAKNIDPSMISLDEEEKLANVNKQLIEMRLKLRKQMFDDIEDE